MLIVDISGYSFSGKSAIYSYLSSCAGIKSFDIEFEFDLIRAPGGLYELYSACTDPNWSIVRSSAAVARYQKLISNLGNKRNILTRLSSIGVYYEDLFPGFVDASGRFLDRITSTSYKSYWPFLSLSQGSAVVTKLKNIVRPQLSTVSLARLNKLDFLSAARLYTDAIFSQNDTDIYSVVILSNAFETSSPQSSIQFFNNAKSIVVDRDPRAIYYSAYLDSRSGCGSAGFSVIGSSVHDFIDRFLLQRQSLSGDSADVLRVRFEDIVQDMGSLTSLISDFLDFDLNLTEHSSFALRSPRVDPWLTEKNDKYLQTSINAIESALHDYCYV
jgi:hypothetical protein